MLSPNPLEPRKHHREKPSWVVCWGKTLQMDRCNAYGSSSVSIVALAPCLIPASLIHRLRTLEHVEEVAGSKSCWPISERMTQ